LFVVEDKNLKRWD